MYNQAITVKPLPGDLAMWIFIAAELTVFALLFLLFSLIRLTHTDLFLEGQQSLHSEAGLINTLALITASWFAVKSVESNRQNQPTRAACWLIAAILAASVYVVVKLWEYNQLITVGFDLDSNAFYTGYFLLTGFHLLHVLLGMIILLFITGRLFKKAYPPGETTGLESGICYWHMVDLVWVLLFPLIYVIR
ncbi:cytochrome c oxidase subunit 3 [uncultured Neptuniibacter sp.]|uniref:cytochrome c oxidase subunit 3 n=1 Tax=uncultured Neptuniibacter sp. TaxID=502143 RepID=UPI0026105E2E|nr:cytochrome c oxidase subunit 3 [uncultured Neptuniibacter sp.]